MATTANGFAFFGVSADFGRCFAFGLFFGSRRRFGAGGMPIRSARQRTPSLPPSAWVKVPSMFPCTA